MPNPLNASYLLAIGVLAASTLCCFILQSFLAPTNLVMVYLLGTLWVATRGYYGPAALTATTSVLAFDFFFVPPRFTFTVSDAQYLWTFAAMFVTAILISHLTIRLREKVQVAEEAAERNVFLFEKAKKAEVEMESERLRSSLLSAVSHDLRTPLTAILGSAGALSQRAAVAQDSEARELVENIQTESERLSRLIQNVLEVTRLESGPVQLRKELYPVEEIVEAALGHLEKQTVGRDVSVKIPSDFPMVPADAVLLEQVFVNLLENALRHTPEGTAMAISAEVHAAEAQFNITDRGPGLATVDTTKLFDKFYRSPTSQGAGLGLAICRAIVVAHGGRIWAENQSTGGAAFRFTLPLKEIHAA